MTHVHMLALPLLGLAMALPSTDAQAQGRGRGGGPPEAAYAACEGKSEGDACDFECRRGPVEGTCQVRRDDRLSCVPNDRGPRGRGRR